MVTGTRAEYGLLRWVMEGVHQSPLLELQVVVTGMHLSPEFGLTVRDIEADGFRIDRKLRAEATFAPLGTVATDTVAFTDATVAPDTTYDYRVVAFNAAGHSPPSSVLAVNVARHRLFARLWPQSLRRV